MGIIYSKGVDNGVLCLGHMIRKLLNPWLAKGAVLSGAWTKSKVVGNGVTCLGYMIRQLFNPRPSRAALFSAWA
jgi:hypothetical protein